VPRDEKALNNKIMCNRWEKSSNLIGSTDQYSCRTNARNAENLSCSHDYLVKLRFI
jgi:hypothetical protein